MSSSPDVDVVITAKETGEAWPNVPYNPTDGLREDVIYEVPTYWADVPGAKSRFKVIRFCVKRTDVDPPPKIRSTIGLAAAQTHTAKWVPSYKTAEGKATGALRLIKAWLIHDGPETRDPDKEVSGSYGCIELCGPGEWQRFKNAIARAGGTTLADLSKKGRIKVKIEAVKRRPDAHLLKIVAAGP